MEGELKCPHCSKKLTLIRPESTEAAYVYIYVDDSNMWIEAKKLASKQLKLKTQEDPRVRFDIGKVTDVVARGREVARGTLYGCEPPQIDSVWKKIKESGWKVNTSQRSIITKREKQVDHQMVADITELVSDSGVTKGTIIVVSGDADVVPAIRAGLKKKWSFEIWMWSSGISSSIYKLKEDNLGLVSIFPLNVHLEDVTFTNFKFNMDKFAPHLKSQSAVIMNVDFDPTDSWERRLSQRLGWPFQFCWIGEKSTNPLEYVDIIVVFASVKSTVDGKNAKFHFDNLFAQLKLEYGEQVVTYPGYHQKFHRKSELSISNRFEKLHFLDSQLSVSNSEDSSDELDLNIDLEGRLGSLSECSAYYDDCAAGKSRPQSLTSENGSTGASGPLSSRATSQSSLCDPNWWGSDGSDSNVEESGGNFVTVVNRKQRRQNQQYSDACTFHSRCKYGLKCKYKHTDAEKKFFKNPCKDRECRFKNNCRKGSRCEFAHSNEEGFCRSCHHWGHLQVNCPFKPRDTKTSGN